jgi:hypothetical protein
MIKFLRFLKICSAGAEQKLFRKVGVGRFVDRCDFVLCSTTLGGGGAMIGDVFDFNEGRRLPFV